MGDKLIKVAFRINKETEGWLDELSKTKYRGSDRATTIRWLIQDMYEQMVFGKEVREPFKIHDTWVTMKVKDE